MTSIADVIALSPTPKRLSQSQLRRTFGVGYNRARALLALVAEIPDDAIALMRLGVPRSEAEAVIHVERGHE